MDTALVESAILVAAREAFGVLYGSRNAAEAAKARICDALQACTETDPARLGWLLEVRLMIVEL